MPMIIKDKPQMYRLYETGAFGNRFRCWSTVDAWYRDHDATHMFNLRYKGRKSGKFVHYNITADEMPRKFCEVILEGYSPKDIHITEGDYNAVDRTLNAEATFMDGMPIVYYSTLPLVMREALAQRSREREGPDAMEFLKGCMDLKSYANLLRLFREYPNHVVEFTSYKNGVGVLGWNTVFWEVRAY